MVQLKINMFQSNRHFFVMPHIFFGKFCKGPRLVHFHIRHLVNVKHLVNVNSTSKCNVLTTVTVTKHQFRYFSLTISHFPQATSKLITFNKRIYFPALTECCFLSICSSLIDKCRLTHLINKKAYGVSNLN